MKKTYLLLAVLATVTFVGCQKDELANPRDNSTPVTVNTSSQASATSIAVAASVPDSSTIGTTSVVKNSDGSYVKTVTQTIADGSTQTFVSTIDKLGYVNSNITFGSETFTAKGTVKADGTIHLVRDGGTSTIKSQTIAIKPDNSNIFWTNFADGTKGQTNVNTDGSIINWDKSSADVVTSLTVIKANGQVVTDTTIVGGTTTGSTTTSTTTSSTSTTGVVTTTGSTTSTTTVSTTTSSTGTVGTTSSSTSTTNTCGKIGTITNSYQPLTPGSVWEYDGYTNTLSTTTQLINGVNYYSNTNVGGTSLVGVRNGDFLTYSQDQDITLIFLRENMKKGDTWDNPNFINGFNVNYKMEVKDLGISHTVNGVTYNDVIKISNTAIISISGSTTSTTIYYYYAKNIGLIESLDEFNVPVIGYSIKCFDIK